MRVKLSMLFLIFSVSLFGQGWEGSWGFLNSDCCCGCDLKIDFTETQNGETSGPGWSSVFVQSAGCSAGYAEDRGNFFETRNGDPGIISLDPLDISKCEGLMLEIRWGEAGDQEPSDCIEFYVTTDVNPSIIIGSFCDDFGGVQTFTWPIPAGLNSVQFDIVMVNCKPGAAEGQAERWRIYDININ